MNVTFTGYNLLRSVAYTPAEIKNTPNLGMFGDFHMRAASPELTRPIDKYIYALKVLTQNYITGPKKGLHIFAAKRLEKTQAGSQRFIDIFVADGNDGNLLNSLAVKIQSLKQNDSNTANLKESRMLQRVYNNLIKQGMEAAKKE